MLRSRALLTWRACSRAFRRTPERPPLMGWISAEGVAAVVQGAVRIPFKILFEFKNIQIPLFQVRTVGVCVGWVV